MDSDGNIDIFEVVKDRMRKERSVPVSPLALGYWAEIRLTRQERLAYAQERTRLGPSAFAQRLSEALVASGRYFLQGEGAALVVSSSR